MNYGQRFVTLYRKQGSRPSPWKRNAKKQNGCLRRHFSFWAVSQGLAQTSPMPQHDVAVLVHNRPGANTFWMASHLWQGSRRRLAPKILYHLLRGLGRREWLFFNSAPCHRQHPGFKTIISWNVLAKKATDLQRKSYHWSSLILQWAPTSPLQELRSR